MMYRRWISIHEFRWTPILTFTRRHLRLLDWLEKNVQPVAFIDDPQKIGIAIEASDLRVTIQRTGMVVESGVSDVSFDRLLPALTGIFETLEPRDAVLEFSNVIATVELSDLVYDDARRTFATSVASAPPVVAGLAAADASVLVDLESDELSVQVEWGIVESGELLSRLNNPRISRLQRSVGTEEVRHSRALQMSGGLPDVSVFLEYSGSCLTGGEVTDASGVGDIVGKMEDVVKSVTLSFAEQFNMTDHAVDVKEGAKW